LKKNYWGWKMLNKKWVEDFFLSLIETGFFEFSKKFIDNRLWFAMGQTIDRQKFAFALNRLNYYFKKNNSNYFIKWNVVIDDFPELKDKINKHLEKKGA